MRSFGCSAPPRSARRGAEPRSFGCSARPRSARRGAEPRSSALAAALLAFALLARCSCQQPGCPDIPCEPNQVCDAATGKCLPRGLGAACRLDQDCEGGFVCLGGKCSNCTDTSECRNVPGRPYCDVTAGHCVACASAKDCDQTQGRQVCAQGACALQPCGSDADCATDPFGPRCVAGFCRACVDDGDCAAGSACAGFACSAVACSQSSECGGGLACEGSSCAACGPDQACAEGGRCSAGTCGSGATCANDADCAFPDTCRGGACGTCSSGADCAGGMTCVSNRCAESGSCTSDAGCRAGRTCAQGKCVDASCADDRFAPNRTPASAVPLRSGALLGPLALCPNAEDWFSVSAGDGDFAVAGAIGATPPHVQLWRASSSGFAKVAEGDGAARVDHLPAGSGPLFVRVTGSDAEYWAAARVDPGGPCADDAAEPDGSPSSAPVAQPGTLTGTLCPGDRDVRAFDVPAGSALSAQVTGGAGVALELLDDVRRRGGEVVLDRGPAVSAPAVAVASRQYLRVVAAQPGGFARTDWSIDAQVTPGAGRPDNDRCATAAPLAVGSAAAGTTAGAQDDVAPSCAASGAQDVFYALSLPAAARLHLALAGGSGVSGALALFRGGCSALAELACSASGALDATLPAGDYLVAVDTPAGASGAFSLSAAASAAAPPPANDVCAAEATLAGTASGDVALAGDEAAGSCGGAGGGDAFYALDLAQPSSVTVRFGASYPGAVVYAGGACGQSDLGCGGPGTLFLPSVAAGTLHLAVDGGGPQGGAFTLSVTTGAPVTAPANETCASAAAVAFDGTGAATASGDTRLAADDLRASCAAASGGDVVFGIDFAADTALSLTGNAGFDASVALESPCGGAEQACLTGTSPQAFFPFLAAGSYALVVDAASAGAAGPFSLSLQASAPRAVPANDLCAGATPVALDASGHALVTGSTWRAQDDFDPTPSCTGSPLAGPDVFFTVAATAGKSYDLTLTPSGFDGALVAGGACGECGAGADRSFVAGGVETLSVPAPASGTLVVVVDSHAATAAGDFTLEVQQR